MRLPEQKLWDRLSHLMFGVWQAQRVENRVGINTPGVFFASPADSTCPSGWIELKVYNPPVRIETRWRLPHWTPGQQDWARRMAACGSPVWLVVHFANTDRIYVLGAHEALEAQNKISLFDFRRRYDACSLSWKHATAQEILDRFEESWYDSCVGAAMASIAVGPGSRK